MGVSSSRLWSEKFCSPSPVDQIFVQLALLIRCSIKKKHCLNTEKVQNCPLPDSNTERSQTTKDDMTLAITTRKSGQYVASPTREYLAFSYIQHRGNISTLIVIYCIYCDDNLSTIHYVRCTNRIAPDLWQHHPGMAEYFNFLDEFVLVVHLRDSWCQIPGWCPRQTWTQGSVQGQT
jgi:hypothetical protein